MSDESVNFGLVHSALGGTGGPRSRLSDNRETNRMGTLIDQQSWMGGGGDGLVNNCVGSSVEVMSVKVIKCRQGRNAGETE